MNRARAVPGNQVFDPLRMTDDLSARVLFYQGSGAARMVDMNMGQQDVVELLDLELAQFCDEVRHG